MLILLRFINKVLSKKSSEEQIIHSFIYKYLLFYIFIFVHFTRRVGELKKQSREKKQRLSASLTNIPVLFLIICKIIFTKIMYKRTC